jgi:glycosyltransferase involved in cell wall biosynthesis
LLDDRRVGAPPPRSDEPSRERPLRLLYIGSHNAQRRLEFVYEAVCAAGRQGIPVEFVSVGATEEERERLVRFPWVEQAFRDGLLQILPQFPRRALVPFFASADIGVCTIPPTPAYTESSPTKLAEYLGAGLPVLATLGIPSQEQWIRESGAGRLVPFSATGIGEGIAWFWRQRSELPQMRRSALAFARGKLRYEYYVPVLSELVHLPARDPGVRKAAA